MEITTKRLIQIVLLIALILAAVRVLIIFRSRHPAEPARQTSGALNPDYYVVPKKLHAYDLKSARELTKGPAWVREGYRYVFYPYASRTDFQHPAGTLGPIEKLNFVAVVNERGVGQTLTTPSGQRIKVVEYQVMAVFEKDGRRFSIPIGIRRGDDYNIYADEILFLQDPHDLYKHWSSEVWDAIARHEVKPGMNELQASFAVGYGTLGKNAAGDRVLSYPNGGNPVTVTYHDGKATDISLGTPQARSRARRSLRMG
ncbi:MAG TPA: hypothetical protein VN622_15565 [Clostridia bacterium]|nr:hypothetical protein [Clostridia bacterium]